MDSATDNRFSFDDAPAAAPPPVLPPPAGEVAAIDAVTSPTTAGGWLDLDFIARAQGAAGAVAYCWNISDDSLVWSSNAAAVLGCDPARIATGRRFADLLDSDNMTSRYDTVLRSKLRDQDGTGVPFEIEYRIRPNGRSDSSSVWLEDTGRWFGGADSGPAKAYGLVRVAEVRHQRDQELNFLSSCDSLTGMMNRVRMLEALDEVITSAKADTSSCAFAILAVSNLDVMNEAYGFEIADEVIVAMAQRLRRVMRVGDGIARYSGSKFGVILNGCKPHELAPALERFMRAVRDSVIETRLGPVWALMSIGAVSLPALGDTAQHATARAEEALSEAFRLPSDGYVIYTSSEEREAQRMLNARCATEIVSCLRDGLFHLAFQPVVDPKQPGAKPAFHEALLRMQDTTGAMITAGHLVPIAERLGLIRLIDRAVVHLALATLTEHPQARLSINLSATTVTDSRWNGQILNLIQSAGELASRLIIEVTETAALSDVSTSRQFLDQLRALGCGIAIDDFGAGFTSYRNLKELPLTMIKLDGAFCRALGESNGNRIYVRSMVELAHAFGLMVVAEWVENAVDARHLMELGVDLVQGNFVGEPTIEVPWQPDLPKHHGDQAVEQPAEPMLAANPAEVLPDTSPVVQIEAFTASASSPQAPETGEENVESSLSQLRQALRELQNAVTGNGEDNSLARAS